MSRRALLALSAAVTAFALVVIGGTATYSLRTHAASTPRLAAPMPATPEAVPVDVDRASTPVERAEHARGEGEEEEREEAHHRHHDRRRSHHDEHDDG
jgi:hypothetical protein